MPYQISLTFGKTGESDKGRPPSPGGSSIKTTLSKKKKWFDKFRKRDPGVSGSLPVGYSSSSTLPTPLEVSSPATPLSSGVDTNASVLEVIPSVREPQLALGESDSVENSMESSVRSEESVAVVQPVAAQGATVVVVHEPEPAKDHTLVHGDALRWIGQYDHHNAHDETVQSSSLDQSAILSGLDSIAYAGGASLDTLPPTTAEAEVFGVRIEAPKSPVNYRAVGLLVSLVALAGWSIFCVFLGSSFGGSASATTGDGGAIVINLPSPNCPRPSRIAPLSTLVPPVQTNSRWIFPP